MKQDEIRLALIDGTIHIIARDGLDKASTKQIALATSINEVYIYRCFKNKEDLLSKTFAALDEELAEKTMKYVAVMYMQGFDYETRCRIFFTSVWRFLLGNRDKCLTYVRYYYSQYFPIYSVDMHRQRFLPLMEKFKDAFRDEANIWMIQNHILNVMLDFAIKVHNNQMSESDDYTEHVFRVIYHSVKQYFRNNKESEENYEESN